MPEPTIKANIGGGGGGANVHAHAGEAIAGNLFRAGSGQFQAGPAAQLQQRLTAIRAARAKKGKAKGKGKKPAKPKLSPADKLAARKQKVEANRTAAIAEMANQDAGLAPAGAANLLKLADGGGAEGAGADALVKMGLATQSKTDDKYRLTAAGRSAASALGRGDAAGAIAAIGKAGDAQANRQAKQTERTGKQAAAAKKKKERAKRVAKRAKAKAAAQKKPVAKPPAAPTAPPKPAPIAKPAPPVKPDTTAPVKPPITGIPPAPKRQTTKGIAMDFSTILDDLTVHSGALAELIDDDGAIKAGARHSGSDNKLIQAIYDSAEDICELAEALGATVVDEETEEADAGDMGESIGHEGAPVEGKAVEEGVHVETIYGSEIKSIEDGSIGGFAVLFGDATMPDMSRERDYFTKSTDYWLDHFGWPRPMTYHHGIDEDTRDDPIVGSWTKAIVKDEGIWLEGQLDRAHRYHGAIKELIKRGYLKLSSDSAPQWVIRQRQPNGTHEVKRWPLISASPTVAPAEPRLAGISFKALIAELGIDDIDNPEAPEDDNRERQDAAKAEDDDRARRLMALDIELSLIALEATIA